MFSIFTQKPVLLKSKNERSKEMGLFCSRWFNTERDKIENSSETTQNCLSQCLSFKNSEDMTNDRKYERLEQRLYALEERININEEANQRLHNKWNTMEERLQQSELIHRGDIREIKTRFCHIEQQIDTLNFDYCERLEDNIIVINES